MRLALPDLVGFTMAGGGEKEKLSRGRVGRRAVEAYAEKRGGAGVWGEMVVSCRRLGEIGWQVFSLSRVFVFPMCHSAGQLG